MNIQSKLVVLFFLAVVCCFTSCKSDDDDNCTTNWYRDIDNDGFGDLSNSRTACTRPEGFVDNALDIDDLDNSLNPNSVWQGAPILFEKIDNADWNLESNQDRITDNVWITRANNRFIYNIAQEELGQTGCDTASPNMLPADTEWAFGTVEDGVNTLTFDKLLVINNCNPSSMVNQSFVLHLISDNIYIDVTFLSWTSGGAGGGFSYERATPNLDL